MRFSDYLLEQPLVYLLWQAPFLAQKLKPLLADNDLGRVRRVLDVGCGPGINAPHFAQAEYVGLDHNPRYIEWARRRYRGEFIVADIRTHEFPENDKFDFVLVNSFLHHLTDDEARRVLAGVARAVSPDGFVHILDLVLPEKRSVARWFALHDRGRYARPLEDWRSLFSSVFDVVVLRPYAVSLAGITALQMVYCKGRGRS